MPLILWCLWSEFWFYRTGWCEYGGGGGDAGGGYILKDMNWEGVEEFMG